MSIWNKVLVWLIGVAALGFFYLTVRTLDTRTYWRKSVLAHEKAIERVRAENRKLIDGDPKATELSQMGIRQVRIELDKLLLNRRRAWFNCDPKVKVGEGTAEVTVTIENPAPHGIADKTVLYAFEEAKVADVQKRGRYLGEFKVTKVADKQVTLAPTSELTKRELDRLQVSTSKGPWTLYEIMPRDSHEIFAEMSNDEKKDMLPPESLPEYVKDGQPVAEDDPRAQKVDGKSVYVRPLRDYRILFDADLQDRALMANRFADTTGDTKIVEDALAQAKKQVDGYTADIASAQKDLEKVTSERNLVANVSKAIEEQLTKVTQAISQLIKENQAMAGRIAQQQLDAARRIDERTRAMAQSGTGGR